MTSSDSNVEKAQTHFQELSSSASSLNAASDELTRVVSVLEEALSKLNIGLTVWVTFRSRAVHPPEYDMDQIGYSKINGKWGIAIRHVWGDVQIDEHGEDAPDLFNNAPREMRLSSVDKIPELIEELGKQALETTKRVEQKTNEVRELASIIEKMANEPRRAERSMKGVSFGTGEITEGQLKEILTRVHQHQKFLGELLEQASHWELGSDNLWIYFPADKRSFAELLGGRESLSKINSVVNHVLGYPVRVVVKVGPRTITNSAAGTGRGGK